MKDPVMNTAIFEQKYILSFMDPILKIKVKNH